MHLGIGFWKDFDGFWEGKWRQVGTKIDQKSMSSAKSDFLKNRALAAAGARFLRFWGSKLGAKIDQKSIKKAGQHRKASWHRFFFDFGGFGDPSWEPKWNPVDASIDCAFRGFPEPGASKIYHQRGGGGDRSFVPGHPGWREGERGEVTKSYFRDGFSHAHDPGRGRRI